MIVVAAALKGGVGKTTTSVYLAALAAENRSESVTLVDADPQASAFDWVERAEDRRLQRVKLVEAPTERLLTKSLRAVKDGEITVVDTPPGDDRLLSKALASADVVVVPTRIGGVEPAQVEALLDLVPSDTPTGLVICSAREHTLDHQDSVTEWKQARVPIWGTVPERVAIAAGPEARLLAWEGVRAYREVWDEVTSSAA